MLYLPKFFVSGIGHPSLLLQLFGHKVYKFEYSTVVHGDFPIYRLSSYGHRPVLVRLAVDETAFGTGQLTRHRISWQLTRLFYT